MDPHMLKPLTGLLLSYLLGSIPTAYLFGRGRGIDLRQHGSGNLGATNAFRVLGKRTGTIVLCLDILKGALAVLLAINLFYETGAGISPSLYACLAAVCVVGGHNWTVFLRFKGGKGIATSLGVLIAFSVLIEKFGLLVLIAVGLWLIVFLSSGFVSLASCVSSLALPFLGLALKLPSSITVFLTILAAFSLIRHRENIRKLLQKRESRFNTASLFKKLFRK